MKFRLRILLALTCLLLLNACSNEKVAPDLLEPVGVELDTAVVKIGELNKLTSYSAMVVPKVEELSFESDGTVSVSNIKLGDQVSEGDLLVELDISGIKEQISNLEENIAYNKTINSYTNSELELEVEIAELKYEHLVELSNAYDEYYKKVEEAQKIADEESKLANEKALEEALVNLKEGEELVVPNVVVAPEAVTKPDGNDVTESELVLAKAEIISAELNLSQAKETQNLSLKELESNLEELENSLIENKIYAPFSGTVVYYNNLIAGDKVIADEPLICIANSEHLFIKGDYITGEKIEKAEKIIAMINGNEYEIEYVNMTKEEYTSLVLAKEDIYTEFNFTVSHETIKAGDFVVINVYEKMIENTLIVPINTVFEKNGSQMYVYLVEGDKLVKTEVTVGSSNEVFTEILGGLEEGDVVYVGD